MQESTTCLLVTVLLERLHLVITGTIVERVRLQNLGVHTNIIADYQVITGRDTTESILQIMSTI